MSAIKAVYYEVRDVGKRIKKYAHLPLTVQNQKTVRVEVRAGRNVQHDRALQLSS